MQLPFLVCVPQKTMAACQIITVKKKIGMERARSVLPALCWALCSNTGKAERCQQQVRKRCWALLHQIRAWPHSPRESPARKVRNPQQYAAQCHAAPLSFWLLAQFLLSSREARGRAFPASRHLEVLLPFPTKRHGHLELPPPRTWANSPKGLIPWVNEGINAGTGVLALLKTHQQVIMTPNSVLLSNCLCLFCSTTCWLLKRECRGIPDLAIKFILFFFSFAFSKWCFNSFLFGF